MQALDHPRILHLMQAFDNAGARVLCRLISLIEFFLYFCFSDSVDLIIELASGG